jgi:uncharacterized SAM-binding protein YcdF (DUF218 family)
MNSLKSDLDAIGSYIMPKTPIAPVDVAIVFGTSYRCDVFADHIHDLWTQSMFKRVILTGAPIVRDGTQKESLYLKELLLQKGIPEDVILTEEFSTNTGENIEFSLPILLKLKAQGFSLSSLLGIGKTFASRRCLMTMEKYLPDAKKIFSPINTFSSATNENWQDSPRFVQNVLNEYHKIPQYIKAGLIVEIDLGSK